MTEEEKTYRTKDGHVLSDQDIEALADEAERGYDVERLKERGRAKPERPLSDEELDSLARAEARVLVQPTVLNQESVTEREITDNLRRCAIEVMEDWPVEVVAERLGLLPVGVKNLIARKRWPLATAIRVAEALDIDVRGML